MDVENCLGDWDFLFLPPVEIAKNANLNVRVLIENLAVAVIMFVHIFQEAISILITDHITVTFLLRKLFSQHGNIYEFISFNGAINGSGALIHYPTIILNVHILENFLRR